MGKLIFHYEFKSYVTAGPVLCIVYCGPSALFLYSLDEGLITPRGMAKGNEGWVARVAGVAGRMTRGGS